MPARRSTPSSNGTTNGPQARSEGGDIGARLQRYHAKRDFSKTPEPRGSRPRQGESLAFVVQKHAATRLHYDFRLELDGVMLSWAVPKGPSFDPADKRMAVRTEDHPIAYNQFEGTIPEGQYGAGQVLVWDRGTWAPQGDPQTGLTEGKLVFSLHGHKLFGLWELVRLRKPGERQESWFLFKKRDAYARPRAEFDVITALPDSVVSKPLPGANPVQPPSAARTRASASPGPAPAPAPLPHLLKPQLATLAEAPPSAGEWIYEIKFDGYRLLARFERGKPALITRGGHDWSARLPVLARELARLGLRDSWLDGEIVVLGDDGAPSFNALQNAFDRDSTGEILYFLFDAPFFEGADLRELPLRQRRELLRDYLAVKSSPHVRFSDDFPADPMSVLQSACRMHLEGVIAKRADAPYRSERTDTWLKLKCQQRQEFVVGGFTQRSGAAREVGSLLLGVHDDEGHLVPVGSVGTGWDGATGVALYKRLAQLQTAASPFAVAPKKGRWTRRTVGSERWVRPELVVEVVFGEWTPDGQIRHASFVGVREDKPAAAITREARVVPAPRGTAGRAKPAREAAAKPAGIAVSNPQRVVDPASGLTKIDLVHYYESVAPWMLPHLQGRPVSLVRGPSGIRGQLFFQKHGEKIGIPGIRELDPSLWPGHDALLEVATVEALVGAAQMNVIEFHTWNSMARRIDEPDRMVFDLDPGEGVAWPLVQEGALLVRTLLNELGLHSWLKTSGGKGLHVVVPIAPRWSYDVVKAFSQAIVQHLARTIPARFVAKSGPANRIGKIFVDYLRNGHGATTAAAFSARARPGLGVSMPVAWEQLSELKSGAQWTVATAREYLSFQQADPWVAYGKSRQGLARAMRVLGFEGHKRA